MKQLFSFVSAILVAGTMCAQTITIDGDNTDWATVPMLTEPGAEGPIVKMIIPQEGVGTTLPEDAAFTVMVEGDHAQILAGYPVIYTDADMNNTTGTAPWFAPAMGYDYEMATWSTGTWFETNATGSVREMCLTKAAFDGVPFTGKLGAWLTFNWGTLYIPATPTMDEWAWSENDYHPFYVAPYTYADLAGTHTAEEIYSTHRALHPSAPLQLGSDKITDPELWASWTVELKEATTYYITLDITGTTLASADLWLVDPATNKVVAEFVGEDIDAALGKQVYGSWNLSAVPAGKYMLKLKNHVEWATVALNAITFSTEDPVTAIENTLVETTSKKVVENGQLYIIRGNERFNVLGISVR